jgi:hypothetical protein
MNAKRIVGALLAVSCPALPGCSGAPDGVRTTPSRTPAKAIRTWSAEDLRSVLAPAPRGYEPVLPPEAGSFTEVIKPSKSAILHPCQRYVAPAVLLPLGGREVPKAPTAMVVFVRKGVVPSPHKTFAAIGETLVSLSVPSADRLIGLSVPSACRRVIAGGPLGITLHVLIACRPIDVGAAGKIIGYALYAKGRMIGQDWLLTFKSGGYVGVVSAIGPKADAATVVRFAKNARAYAETALR